MGDTWEQSVLSAFEEWVSIMGGNLNATRCMESEAFIAGAEWQRERDAEKAQAVCRSNGYPAFGVELFYAIRKGDA